MTSSPYRRTAPSLRSGQALPPVRQQSGPVSPAYRVITGSGQPNRERHDEHGEGMLPAALGKIEAVGPVDREDRAQHIDGDEKTRQVHGHAEQDRDPAE